MISRLDKSITIRVIRSWREFEDLRGQWDQILEQSDANNIFLTWQWVDCWRKSQTTEINPLIVVLEEFGEMLAIAPFYLQEYKLCNLVKYKTLRFVADHATGSEYSNFIVKHCDSLNLKTLLWQSLLEPQIKSQWDFIWLTNISAWTAGGKSLLQSLSQVTALLHHQRTVEFAQISLDGVGKDILPKLSKSLRTNIRQTATRLEKLGPWKLEITVEDSELALHLDNLFCLHNRRWQSAGLKGTFERRPELVAFYRAFVPLALENGWLRLLRLEANGEIQAMQLGYVYQNTFLAIQEGYNPEFLPGAGQVLRHFSFNNCIDEELSSYDFLGVYTNHKRRWLADKKFGCNLFIWHDQPKSLPFKLAPIWPTGRYLNQV